MALYKRGKKGIYWVEFVYAGQRIRESTKTTRKAVAVEYERGRKLELERAFAGIPTEDRLKRMRSVSDAVGEYLEALPLNHRPKTVVIAGERLAHVKRIMAGLMVHDITEDRARAYIRTRLGEGVSGRTVNMELDHLSRAMGQPWAVLWPHVNRLEERSDVGRALSPDEEERILRAATASESANAHAFIRLALLTGMRSDEARLLTWAQVDLGARLLTVGRAKSKRGTGRQIPINNELHAVLTAHAAGFESLFGERKPHWYVFPKVRPGPRDPERPQGSFKKAWASILKAAKVQARLHDLRHTLATKLAERGVPESTMLAIMGHMSRRMLERYSHIRMQAKRDAMESVSLANSPRVDGVPTNPPTSGDSAVVQ